MNDKTYILRRKITKFKPTPIPETTYVPETFKTLNKLEPIKAIERFEEMSKPKPVIRGEEIINEIPKYQNNPPNFEPVDFRVTQAELERDLYLIRQKTEKEAKEKAEEPTDFLRWQEKMKNIDEQERKEIINKRHQELDNSRKNAIKAKKKAIKERLELGKKLRFEFGEEIKLIQEEINQERENIKLLKESLKERGPSATEIVQRERREATKAMKKQLRSDLKAAAKLKSEEQDIIRKNAKILREATLNHTMLNGDAYRSKLEITQTTFLAALTDEETNELIEKHKNEKKEIIEREIEYHRKIKEEKMDKMVEMLDKITKYREEQEEIFNQQKKQKLEQIELEKIKKQKEEYEKILELEKKLEKKRKSKIKEAEKMEEHMREIQARNRYLAINKKALVTKGFQSQQDAKLRTAKERQNSSLKEDIIINTPKNKNNIELTNLKNILGL